MSVCYEPGLVARVLPFALDPEHGWGVSLGEGRPDPSMPRGSSDPSKHGGVWAVCADVQRAFAALSVGDRRVVWLRFRVGLTQAEAAAVLGVSQQSVWEREFSAVRRMCVFLNGCELGDGLGV